MELILISECPSLIPYLIVLPSCESPPLQPHFQPSMSDYLPYGKLNEGVQHVDVGVTVALPETEVQGCSVHLASDDYHMWAKTRKQLGDNLMVSPVSPVQGWGQCTLCSSAPAS